jgi:hypothetical protein
MERRIVPVVPISAAEVIIHSRNPNETATAVSAEISILERIYTSAASVVPMARKPCIGKRAHRLIREKRTI